MENKEKNIDLNSLSISELEQMVRDIDDYKNRCYNSRLKYHTTQLDGLREDTIKLDSFEKGISDLTKGDISFLEIGNNYGFYEEFGSTTVFSIAELIKMDFTTEDRYHGSTFCSLFSHEYCLNVVECYFRREEDLFYDVKDNANSDVNDGSIRLTKKSVFYGSNVKKAGCGDAIFQLNKNLLDIYYDSVQDVKNSFQLCSQQIQLAKWKKQEIEEIIKEKQTSLIGEDSEYERLSKKYGKSL